MNFNGHTPVQMSRLSLKLKPIFIGQLINVPFLRHPAFHFENNFFEITLKAERGITTDFIREFAQNHSSEIFVHEEDFAEINNRIKLELTKLTRSLSQGDPNKNAIRHTNLLTMQMDNLYKNPFDDELLSSQFQNSKNLGNLLLNNSDIHKNVFNNIKKSHYHYTVTQPLLSSILLLSFIQNLKIFNDKEIEGLFLTSYFKDIGMSFIPREKFELSHLNEFDQALFTNHAQNSMMLLSGRVPLGQNQLSLIENHHYLNYKIQTLSLGKNPIENSNQMISGIESVLLSALDILTAMTNDRPYRHAVSPFQALELLKKVISDEFPHEFRSLVLFIKNFTAK